MSTEERGFTLIEVLIALVVFAIIIVGAIGVLGATSTGGLVEGLPTGLITGRVAKDVTAASTYLQALQEFIAQKGSDGVTPDTYCAGTCGGETPLPVDYPTPSSQGLEQPYQLDWTTLIVVIERWGWSSGTGQYVLSPGCTGSDCLVRVESVLTWQLKGAPRTIRVQRFIP